ncbi:50S ribosomal protein L10 [Desulfovibrio sp. X2]|uniref:50S ribosomal protein L10 n=1 Tax=Desulfovibrio sp. X2 TaxID=941449 RepID=UPI000358CE3B|nr:50S ribosomal protein L10 [Desulfovibrio sp. X2]EPR43742.1 50S ribosomal protein L10 [Desulfovibrio sp. X2]
MNRTEKAQVIEELKGVATPSSIAVLTDFKGMTVEEMTELRVKLRSANVAYHVVKNTLARIALSDCPHQVLGEKLKENNAIAFGYDDPVAAAKILTDFLRENPKSKLVLKAASLEGKFLSEAQLKDLAKLPGRQELLAMLLGTMNAVPQNFVGVLAAVLRGFLNVLTAVKDQKDEAPAA